MSPRLRWHAALVGLVGAATLAWALTHLPLGPVELRRLVPLCLVALASVLVPSRFQRGQGGLGVSLENGVFVALVVAVPTGLVPLVLTGTQAAGSWWAFKDLSKSALTTSRTALSVSFGALIFDLVGPATSVLAPRTLGAVGAAMVVMELTDRVILAELLRRQGPGRFRESIREVSELAVVTAVGNTAFGLVLGFVARNDPFVTLLTGTLLVALFLGYRGYRAALEEDRRATAHHDVTRLLLDVSPSRDQLSTFLQRLVALLDGRSAELVLQDSRHLVRTEVAGTNVSRTRVKDASKPAQEAMWRTTAVRSDTDVEPWLLEDDHRSALAAPLVHSGRTIGAVVVYDRRGLTPWSDADATYLGAVANEAAAAVRTIELFQQVERERQRWEQESTKLADVLNAASDGIAMIDPDGKVRTWNPGIAAITGVDAEDADGQSWFTVLRIRDQENHDLLPGGNHPVIRALEEGIRIDAVDLQMLRRDGSWRWVACSFAPPEGEGRPGTVVVARDRTSEVEVEGLKADFVATVSHELRTPLTPLKGFIQTFRAHQDTFTDEQRTRMLDGMGKQVDRLERLVSDLLVVADLEQGEEALAREVVSLTEAVREAVELEPGSQQRVRVATGAEVTVVGDSPAVVRIIRALISNGLKHTDGPVDVRVVARDGVGRVDVADHGQGIPPWEQDRVFGRFSRLGDHLHRPQGPGLGLSIARSLAQRMGGDVELRSDVGTGSVFSFSVPLARPRAVEERDLAAG